jgi:tetratricopeptide (TPR) repeat protein
MMAGKLSSVARLGILLLLAGGTWQVANFAIAENEGGATATAKVIENPYVASKPQPPGVANDSQTPRRAAASYRNPFSKMSKAPPVDTSLRPGPISRWQRPAAPTEPSAVKSAVTDSSPMKASAGWDQLPPTETLINRAAGLGLYNSPGEPPDPVQFALPMLTQPTWLTDDGDPILHSTPCGTGVPNPMLRHDVFSLSSATIDNQLSGSMPNQNMGSIGSDLLQGTNGVANDGPALSSDFVATAEKSLDLAQQTARDAKSIETLSAVAELCQRGLYCEPNATQSTSLRRLAAWAHNRRGELLIDGGKQNAAIEDFQKAISLDPECSLAIHNRAVTLAQQEDYAAALRDFNRVIELNPGLAIAYRNRAELLAALGRMGEATTDYTRAIDGLPDDAELYRARAFAWQRLGKVDRALADVDRAIELAPNEPEALIQRGNLAAEQGIFDKAATDFQRALAIDDNSAEAHRSLAWLLATCPIDQLRDPQQALASAQKAARLAPGDYLVLDTLAAAQAGAGRFDEAVEIEQHALKAAPPELATALQARLTLYSQGQAYCASSARSFAVRTASHESPVESSPTQSGKRPHSNSETR